MATRLLIEFINGKFRAFQPGKYHTENHLYGHAKHLYDRLVRNAIASLASLEDAMKLELTAFNSSLFPTTLPQYWYINEKPHEFGCSLFAVGPTGTIDCGCSYANKPVPASAPPPGYPYGGVTQTPLGQVTSAVTDDWFEQSWNDLFNDNKKRGLDPMHTCEESPMPLFREGTGEAYTFCIRCGKWIRPWTTERR